MKFNEGDTVTYIGNSIFVDYKDENGNDIKKGVTGEITGIVSDFSNKPMYQVKFKTRSNYQTHIVMLFYDFELKKESIAITNWQKRINNSKTKAL